MAEPLQRDQEVMVIGKVLAEREGRVAVAVADPDLGIRALTVDRAIVRTAADLEAIADEVLGKAMREQRAKAALAALAAVEAIVGRRASARRSWWRR